MKTTLQTTDGQIKINSKLISDKNHFSIRLKSILASFWLFSLASAMMLLLLTASVGPVQAQQDEFLLHSFQDSSINDGLGYGNLVRGSDGNFYGTTAQGGSIGVGTVFMMTPVGHVTVLHSFADGTVPNDGYYGSGPVVEGQDGMYYGTAQTGGPGGDGIVFKISSDGKDYKILHSFPDKTVKNDGSYPDAGLILGSDGNFYGTTTSGGSGSEGTVFKITSSGTVTILHSFNEQYVLNDGGNPSSPLFESSDGSFYGTTTGGGAPRYGTVYKLTKDAVYSVLHQFRDGSVSSEGEIPVGSLAEGSDGDIYGTTSAGGSAGLGTVYKVTPDGVATKLHSFADGTVPEDGTRPASGLVAGPDGLFYGTTEFGGYGSDNEDGTGGTVFKVTSAGKESNLHSFNIPGRGRDGWQPVGNLIIDKSGSLYGTTQSGGSVGLGTIFKLQTTPSDLLIANVLFYQASSPSDFATGLVSLTVPAPAGGYTVRLTSAPYAGLVPPLVNIEGGKTSASFPVQRVTADSGVAITITAYAFGAGDKSASFLTP